MLLQPVTSVESACLFPLPWPSAFCHAPIAANSDYQSPPICPAVTVNGGSMLQASFVEMLEFGQM